VVSYWEKPSPLPCQPRGGGFLIGEKQGAGSRRRVLLWGVLLRGSRGSFVQSPEFMGAHHCKIVVFHVNLQKKMLLSLKDVSVDVALSFDGFRTLRSCHLVWRHDNSLGVFFENRP
jgi:hypothetical protein